MYNQQVKWNNALGDSYITKWTYSPLKYWPNEVANVTAAVEANGQAGNDDQENDANTNPSFTASPRGNVSFFAYAPYVPVTASTGVPTGDVTSGITAISKNSDNGDPIVSYKVAAEAKDNVDLLWGVYDNTSKNVNDAENAGVVSTAVTVVSTPIGSPTIYDRTSYAVDILQDYTTNADLTKQKTNGTINFLFKHALAKVGGGAEEIITPSGVKINKGLMVVLDIDDEQGAETGGERETFETNYKRTVVTIKSIKISNDLAGTGVASDKVINGATYSGISLKTSGDFDLATGKWTLGSNSLVSQTIGTTKNSSDDDNTLYSSELKDGLKEFKTQESGGTGVTYISDFATKKNYFHATTGHIGVTETPQNVFKDENAAPLVFIPGQKPDLRFDIDYVVRTYDENLASMYSEVEQKISKIVSFTEDFLLNKQYNILMHLGLTSVKFTASVSNWDDYKTGTGNYDSDGDGTNDITLTEVYLPRNVSGLMTTFDKTFVASDDAADITLTEAKYYIGNEEQDVTSSATLNLSDVTPTNWITVSGQNLDISANVSFTDKTAKVNASITSPASFTSENVSIIQYGRTATDVQITWTSAPTITDLANTASGSPIDLAPNNIQAKGYETKNDGTASATTVALKNLEANDAYEFVFIDDLTGKKATWITVTDNTKISLDAQSSGAPARSATLWVKLNGKLVKTTSDGTNAIKVTQVAG